MRKDESRDALVNRATAVVCHGLLERRGSRSFRALVRSVGVVSVVARCVVSWDSCSVVGSEESVSLISDVASGRADSDVLIFELVDDEDET